MVRFGSLVLVCMLLTAMMLVVSPDTVDSDGNVVINEIRIDQPGPDHDEYFELAGTAGASLDGLTYVIIGDGPSALGSGVIEVAIDLAGQAIPVSGYFVTAESTFTLGTADMVTNLNFENSDNVTHLLVRDFTGHNGDDLDTNDDGVLDVMPWADIVDLIAVIEETNPPGGTEYHYGPPEVGPDGGQSPGHVFRCAAGWEIGDFDPNVGDDTPGAANKCCSDVDGDGVCDSGPIPGVTTWGIITLVVAIVGIGMVVLRKRVLV